MNSPDPAPVGLDPIVDRAAHAGTKYQEDINDCDRLVAQRTGLDYISHISSGVWDFSVHYPSPRLQPDGFDQVGRQLNLVVTRIDATAEQLDSGPLIRVVVQGEDAALFHILKVAGQTLFGVTLDGAREAVDRADQELAHLADRAAARIGSPPLLWGGYLSGGHAEGTWLPETTRAGEDYPDCHERATGLPPVSELVARRCRNALAGRDVHFIGIYRRDTLLWRTDILADPALGSLFQRVSPADRRRGYDKVMRQVTMQASRMTRLLSRVGSKRLTRLVLDVARGAIYVLPLADGVHYLVGVTLLQHRVREADAKMTALHRDLLTAFPAGR